MPAVVLLLLCGPIQPRAEMAHVLRAISYALPMTWAYDALAHAMKGAANGVVACDAVVVVGVTIAALALGATTLRCRTG